MTPKLIHESKDIFPDPFMFNPERWENDEVHLKKYLGTFSKGGEIVWESSKCKTALRFMGADPH
jgi:hypothetical protein